MKNTLFITIAILLSGFVNAQDLRKNQVPSVVLNSFNKSFPNAAKVDWEKKGDLFNADFEIGRRDHEILLNSKGQVVRHKQDIASKSLPIAVKNNINQKYKSFRIDDVEKIEEGKSVFYKVELKKLREEHKLYFDKNGNTINKNI
jgi:hypothetical protein